MMSSPPEPLIFKCTVKFRGVYNFINLTHFWGMYDDSFCCFHYDLLVFVRNMKYIEFKLE